MEESKGKTFELLLKENKMLNKQLEYLRSGEYYNQLRFERDLLQNVIDNGEVSKEDKEFIDMAHRNTELLEKIENITKYLEDNIDVLNNQSEAIEGLDLFEQHSLIIYQDILERVKSGKYE